VCQQSATASYRHLQRGALSLTHTPHTHNTPRFILLQVIELSATAKLPIIAICNEEHSPKIRSLASKCLKIRFYRPRPWQLLPRLRYIYMYVCIYMYTHTHTHTHTHLPRLRYIYTYMCVYICTHTHIHKHTHTHTHT